MRNEMTTGRRGAVVRRLFGALVLIAIFVLHPACPPEPSHHGTYVPGLSADLCHHGETRHLSAAAPAQAAVPSHTASVADTGLPAVAWSPGSAAAFTSCQSRSEHVSSGRALLVDLGISRT